MCNYDIIVAKIYDYALIDSFLGSAGLIDSPTSSDTLLCGTVCGTTDVSTNSLMKNCGIWRRERSQTLAASVLEPTNYITFDTWSLVRGPIIKRIIL